MADALVSEGVTLRQTALNWPTWSIQVQYPPQYWRRQQKMADDLTIRGRSGLAWF